MLRNLIFLVIILAVVPGAFCLVDLGATAKRASVQGANSTPTAIPDRNSLAVSPEPAASRMPYEPDLYEAALGERGAPNFGQYIPTRFAVVGDGCSRDYALTTSNTDAGSAVQWQLFQRDGANTPWKLLGRVVIMGEEHPIPSGQLLDELGARKLPAGVWNCLLKGPDHGFLEY